MPENNRNTCSFL